MPVSALHALGDNRKKSGSALGERSVALGVGDARRAARTRGVDGARGGAVRRPGLPTCAGAAGKNGQHLEKCRPVAQPSDAQQARATRSHPSRGPLRSGDRAEGARTSSPSRRRGYSLDVLFLTHFKWLVWARTLRADLRAIERAGVRCDIPQARRACAGGPARASKRSAHAQLHAVRDQLACDLAKCTAQAHLPCLRVVANLGKKSRCSPRVA